MGKIALLALAAGLLSVANAPTGVLANIASAPSASAGTVTFWTTYDYFEWYEVPAGVTHLDITLTGGAGGEGVTALINDISGDRQEGGKGASVTIQRLAVTPGQILYLRVGGNGSDWVTGSGEGGIGGGGRGGVNGGGGGGGATWIASDVEYRVTNTETWDGEFGPAGEFIVMAAGGGGGGGSEGIYVGGSNYSPWGSGGPLEYFGDGRWQSGGRNGAPNLEHTPFVCQHTGGGGALMQYGGGDAAIEQPGFGGYPVDDPWWCAGASVGDAGAKFLGGNGVGRGGRGGWYGGGGGASGTFGGGSAGGGGASYVRAVPGNWGEFFSSTDSALTPRIEITPSNVVPVVHAGPDATISEGNVFSGSGFFADPDADEWWASVDYGDGSGEQPLALNADKSFNLGHVYADNGVYTVTVTVTDDDWTWGLDTAEITVNNVSPTAEAGGPFTVDEGAGGQMSSVFDEQFDSLEPAVWNVQQNGYPVPVSVDGVTIHVGAPGVESLEFPYVTSRDAMFPASGDFALDVSFHYSSIAGYGSGLSTIGGDLGFWQDAATGLSVNGVGNLGVDGGWHLLRYIVRGSDATVFLDGRQVGSFALTSRPTGAWFGHPAPSGITEAGTWTTFELDFIRVVSLPGNALVGSGTDPGADTLTYAWDLDNDGVYETPWQIVPNNWPDNGTYIVGLQVTDDDGGVGTDTTMVTVSNVAPVVDAGPDATISEGDVFYSSGSFSDPGADVWAASVDYGDGTGVQSLSLTGKSFSLSHTYAGNGVYTVAVEVCDDDGGCTTDTATVTVSNVAPTAEAGGPYTVDEGASGQMSSVFDEQFDSLEPAVWNVQQNGYPVSVSVGGGTVHVGAPGVESLGFPFVGNNVNPFPATGDFALDVSFHYTSIAGYGSGLYTPGADMGFWQDTEGLSVGGVGNLGVDGGWHLLRYIVRGSEATVFLDGRRMGSLALEDRPWGVWFGHPAPSGVPESAPWTTFELDFIRVISLPGNALVGSGTDPGADTLTYAWDLDNDGVYETPGQIIPNNWPDNGAYNVGLQVTDDDGSVGTDTATVVVNNVAPTAVAGGPYGGQMGDATTFDGSLSSDPGSDQLDHRWRFGDGTMGAGVSVSHTYAAAGTYTVTLTVTDDDGATSNTITTATVVSPPAQPQPEGPVVYYLDPAKVVEGGDAFTLHIRGTGFSSGTSSVSWGGASRTPTSVADTEITLDVTADDVQSANGDIRTVLVTVTSNGQSSNTVPFTITRADVQQVASAAASGGQQTTVSTAPAAEGAVGVSATLTNNSGGGESSTAIAVATYAQNPTNATTFDVGGGYVDLQVSGASASDQVSSTFYYPSTVVGDVETNLALLYFDGTSWNNVFSSGGLLPLKNITDNQNGTVSGGTFTVIFDDTSTPGVADLAGTQMTMAVVPEPTITEAPIESLEGTAITLGSSVTHPDPAAMAAGFSLEWTVAKDGTLYSVGSGPDFTVAPSQDGTYEITLIATDVAGGSGSDTVTVTVNNVAPVVDAGDDATGYSADVHSVNASFTDSGMLDTHTAIIDWGDTTSEAGTVAESSGSGTVTGSHQYLVPGDYTITVTVTDKDAGVGSDTQVKTVLRLPVIIDIKPGADPNPLNLNGNGVVPVTVLSTADFDATTIDVSTVLFGMNGIDAAPVHDGHVEDVNGDGLADLVLHFREGELGIPVDAEGNSVFTLTLTGVTYDGVYVEGQDEVRITPNNDRSQAKGGVKTPSRYY